jgi:CDP-diacylglycerol---serine O-phosphatidyltransferase
MPPAAGYPAGVRLLPNAVTVVALCSGLSAVYFAFSGRFALSVAAAGVAALCDALDGRLARFLDASTKIGAELDSLSDLIAFGVSPALLFYIWRLDDTRFGWVVALVFAVCMALRLARFNTLIDAEARWPFAKEFFVGVPAPAAALVGGLPLLLWLQLGDGWWSAPLTVGLWALLAAGLMVSRLPTISLKTARVPTSLYPLALVLVGLGFAFLVVAPFLLMSAIAVGYLLLVPFTIYRFEWLKRHPEAWDVPTRERRAVARAARSARRLGLRSPLRRRVAGGARTVARAVFRPDEPPLTGSGNGATGGGTGRANGRQRGAHGRERLRLGLRRR